jgi:hypothetical protein
MPDSYIEWAWFAFFCLGTIGGWGALLRTLQLWVDDRWQSEKQRHVRHVGVHPACSDYDVEFTDTALKSAPCPDTRTRANLPIYQPRRR